MRCSTDFIQLLRRGDQEPILGISLGFTFVSEHECGQVYFEGDQVDPRGLRLYEFSGAVYLIYWPGHFIPDWIEPNPAEMEEKDLERLSGIREPWGRRRGVCNTIDLACAWSTSGFIIGATRDDIEVTAFLQDLYRAFCIGQGRAHLQRIPWGRPQWTLCVYVQPVDVIAEEQLSLPRR